MQEKQKIRVGLVGLGRWGSNHLRVLSGPLKDQVELTIFDKSKEATKRAANGNKEISVAKSLPDVLKNTDAIIVATPSESHFDISRKAILKGKDVLIEKPVTSTVGGATALIADIVSASLKHERPILMVDHILLHCYAIERILDIVHSGEIGEPVYYRASRTNFGWAVPTEDVINSLMIHDVYSCEYLLGAEIAEVTDTTQALDFSDVTTTGFTDNGIAFTFTASWSYHAKERFTQITGTKGTILWDDDKKTVSILPYLITNEGEFVREERAPLVLDVKDSVSPLEGAIRHFLDCVQTRESPISGLEEGRRALSVCEAIRSRANNTC